ncbi:pyridoxal phosphate phosphatase [Erysipelotrichaceae bacterium]|nr:pyridoxal phosphate phosphatase [Erysipelotrichaceae bacterium]
MKHAIFFDLDGTLLNSHNTICKQTIATVEALKLAGHTIFIATGRQFYATIPFHKQLGLNTPIITLNGGAIYDKDGILLQKTFIDPLFVTTILQDKTFANITEVSNFETPNLSVMTNKNPGVIAYLHQQMPTGLIPNYGNTRHHFSSFPILSQVVNMYSFVASDQFEDLKIYLNKTITDSVSFRYGDDPLIPFVEIFSKNCSKATGIAYVLNYLGLDDIRTMAFGDGQNDFEMLEYVDVGVAMKNAVSSLVACSDEQTPLTHQESGVSDFLNTYFKI